MLRLLLLATLIAYTSLASAQTLIKQAQVLRSEIQSPVEDTVQVNRLIQLAQTELFIGLRDSAILHSKQGALLSASLNYLRGIVESKLILVSAEIDNKNYSAADSEWRKAIVLIPQISDKQDRKHYEASLYSLKGIFWTRRLKPDSALHYLKIAGSKLSPEQGDKEYERLRITILKTIGQAFTLLAEKDSATSHYLSALELAEKMQDTVMMARVCNDYAISLQFYLPNESLRYALRAVNFSDNQGMMLLYGKSLSDAAFIYQKLHKEDSSCIFYRKALEITRMYSRDSNQIAGVLTEYTIPLITLDSLDHAEKLIKEAWALSNQEKFSYSAFNTLWQYCIILHQQKKYDQERQFIKTAENILGDYKIPDCADALYTMKIDYYKATGNYRDALDQLEKLIALRDTVQSEQQTLAVAELNTKYETEKKDKEIIKLNAEQEIAAARISRQRILVFMLIGFSLLLAVTGFSVYKRIQLKRKTEMEIARLEQVNQIQNIRNRISRDMHDDIGASLSKMGMLAQQAKLQVQKGNVESSLGTFDKITSQSKEAVSGLSTIIWAINPQHDNLKSMLGFMRNYISDFFEGNAIQYSINFPDAEELIIINPELKRNLFLVLKESLNNIVKHSGATEVTIRFVTGRGKYQFEIADNGTGIDATKDKSFSNGLISMKKRMEEVQGLFHLNTNNGRGTGIELEGVFF